MSMPSSKAKETTNMTTIRREVTLPTLEVVNGHLIGHFADGTQLIDAGAPLSVPASPGLQELVGTPLTAIAGLDQFDGRRAGFDLSAGRLLVGLAVPEWGNGETLPLRRRYGIPIARIQCGGRWYDAIVDTGAQLSYAPAAVVHSAGSRETRLDFAPGIAPQLGQFEVETGVVTIRVGSQDRELRVARAPAEISAFLNAMGMPDWIIGAGLFLHGRVILDLRDNKLIFPDGNGAG